MKATFFAKSVMIGAYSIVYVPKDLSLSFSSRGLVFGRIATSYDSIILPLEPDGLGGHWFDASILLSTELRNINNEGLEIEMDTDVEWPSPEIPEDLLRELQSNNLLAVWDSLTVKAKWEWLRWVRSTPQVQTRIKRVRTACDKLGKGMRRPCCYDQTKCSVPELSKNGKLISLLDK